METTEPADISCSHPTNWRLGNKPLDKTSPPTTVLNQSNHVIDTGPSKLHISTTSGASHSATESPQDSIQSNQATHLNELRGRLDWYLNHPGTHTTSEQARLELLEIGHQVVALFDSTDLKPLLLSMLSELYNQRSKSLNDLKDLDASIDFRAKAIQTRPDQDQQNSTWIHKMGSLYLQRYSHSNALEDLRMVIRYEEQAILLSSGDIPCGLPGNLGIARLYLFQRLGNLEDIEKAVEAMQQAALLTSDNDPYKGASLGNLANAYLSRFDRFGKLDDITHAIDCHERAVLFCPEGHKFRLHWLQQLAYSYQRRFERQGLLNDIEKAVAIQEQSVLICPNGPKKQALLVDLGNSYNIIFGRLGDLETLRKGTSCFHEAVALATDDTEKLFGLTGLGTSYHSMFECLGNLEDLEAAIRFQKKVIELVPTGYSETSTLFNNLGISYWSRFQRLGELRDLDEAISCKTQAVLLTPDGHPEKMSHLDNLGNSYQLLYERLRNLRDLEEAIKYRRQAVLLAPDSHPYKHQWLNNLGASYDSLFGNQKRLDDLDMALDYHRQSLSLLPVGHPGKASRLNNLAASYRLRFDYLRNRTDNQEAIKLLEQSVLLTPSDHPERPARLAQLGGSYSAMFEYSRQLEDIDRAVDYLKQAVLTTPDGHREKPNYIFELGTIYWLRFQHSKDASDNTSAMWNARQAANISTGNPTTRLRASRNWARMSCARHGSTLEAYTYCMTLLPQIVWLGVSMHQRFESLAIHVQGLANEAAAAAISVSQLELAVTWLEQGRSIVWNQILQLRIPFDTLSAVSPHIARELKEISCSLEKTSLSESTSTTTALDPLLLQKEAQKHRRLAEKWDEVFSTAQSLPELHDILGPPSLSTLRNLIEGALVIVNVTTWRCDALILQEGVAEITHVPLVNLSHNKLENARSKIGNDLQQGSQRGFRRDGPRPTDHSFEQVLAMLWYDAVQPIVEHLGYNELRSAEELPRITWCPTGPLSFLPLHAAGDYSSPNTMLVNLVVSSYTPTLSALHHSQSSPGAFTGILAIGLSSTPGLDPLASTRAEIKKIKDQAGDLRLTELTEDQARTDTVLPALEDHSWVHFACHASQNIVDPLRSSFHLRDGSLDLAAIVSKPLRNAQLAFLSACQTATGDVNLPEESVHLAAGLLMAGYPAVIATMWSIHDNDAPLVAGEVYKCLLEGGVPDSRKAAVALHKAVSQLRNEIGQREFARWVPYIHIGR